MMKPPYVYVEIEMLFFSILNFTIFFCNRVDTKKEYQYSWKATEAL